MKSIPSNNASGEKYIYPHIKSSPYKFYVKKSIDGEEQKIGDYYSLEEAIIGRNEFLGIEDDEDKILTKFGFTVGEKVEVTNKGNQKRFTTGYFGYVKDFDSSYVHVHIPGIYHKDGTDVYNIKPYNLTHVPKPKLATKPKFTKIVIVDTYESFGVYTGSEEEINKEIKQDMVDAYGEDVDMHEFEIHTIIDTKVVTPEIKKEVEFGF